MNWQRAERELRGNPHREGEDEPATTCASLPVEPLGPRHSVLVRRSKPQETCRRRHSEARQGNMSCTAGLCIRRDTAHDCDDTWST